MRLLSLPRLRRRSSSCHLLCLASRIRHLVKQIPCPGLVTIYSWGLLVLVQLLSLHTTGLQSSQGHIEIVRLGPLESVLHILLSLHSLVPFLLVGHRAKYAIHSHVMS